MIHLKFNWPFKGELPGNGRFKFGDSYHISEMELKKETVPKACTLEAMAEHESKVSQLQLVCNATAITLEVCEKSRAEYKWLAQVKGTPVPNTSLYYYRTPEECASQKCWRFRLKFLFSNPQGSTVVRIQSLDISFDNLTRRTISRSGSQLSMSRSSSQMSLARSTSQLSVGGPADGKTDSLLKQVTAELKSEGTASCSTASTGSRTPTSDVDISDLGSLASAADKSEGPYSRPLSSSSRSSSDSREGGHFETKKTPPVRRVDSSSSVDSISNSSQGSSGRRRSRREVTQQHKLMADFVAVVDGVVSQLTAKARSQKEEVLIRELIMLRDRVQSHANLESLDNLDLSADVAKFNSLLTSRLPGP